MNDIVLQPGGFRPEHFIRLAYAEEGRACPVIDERVEPTALLFPRSFVQRVSAMSGEKLHDYSFMGALFRPEIHGPRAWVLDFARTRFTARSHLQLSDPAEGYVPMGPWDHTGERSGVVVPKDLPPGERAFFNPRYYEVLRSTEHSLCPAGDLPWSLRFFEAIMCRSIPVVSDLLHTGRNDLERAIGYHVAMRDDVHHYDAAVAEENFRLFLRHQTLLDDQRTV